MKTTHKQWFILVAVAACMALLLCACTTQTTRTIDQMDMLQSALGIIEQNYIGEMDVDKLDYVAAEAIINSLDDFSYLSHTLYSQATDSSIGLSVKITRYNEYIVSWVDPDMPAAAVFGDFQLQRGDEIYGLKNSNLTDDDGIPVFYRLRGLSSSYFSRYTEGGADTVLTLRIVRDGQVMGDFPYTKISAYTPRAYYVRDVFEDNSNIGYILLRNFTFTQMPDGTVKSAADDFDQCMTQFRLDHMRALILDLRGNGGGNTDILSAIAQYFVPVEKGSRTDILQLEYAKTQRSVWVRVEENNNLMRYLPLVILCDENTASAAEALIGACRAYHGQYTTVIGTPTYGKGVFQRSDIEINDITQSGAITGIIDRYYVVLVSGYYYIIDPNVEGGRYNIHQNPLQPDIVVAADETIGALAQDAEMAAAKEHLMSILSDN